MGQREGGDWRQPRKRCVCIGAGQRAQAGAQRRVREMPGWWSRAAPAQCQTPWEGSEQRQCRQWTGRERTMGSWMLVFFHKTTHFLALLPMHGVPDPEPSSPHISCISHLTLQTHRNLGFLSSGEGLTAIPEKGWLTPRPRKASMGITFSWAMHCRILGAPYSPPMQEARDEMYSPSKNKNPTKDTWRKQRECKVHYIVP